MGNFEEALERLSRLDGRLRQRPRPSVEGDLDAATLQGLKYKPGDRVTDPVTGQEAEVVDSRFLRRPVAAPRDGRG